MYCENCSGTGKMPWGSSLNCPTCNGKGYLGSDDIREGMKVSTHVGGMCCDVIEHDGELYLIDASTGEDVGKVKDNFEYIESII